MNRLYTVTDKIELEYSGSVEDLQNIIDRVKTGDLAHRNFTHWVIDETGDCSEVYTLYFERRVYETDEEYMKRKERQISAYKTEFDQYLNSFIGTMRYRGLSESDISSIVSKPMTD